MNVKQMRQQGERFLRHAPNTPNHRDEWLDRLNQAQERLYLSEFWSFRRRTHEMRLNADVELTAGNYTGNPTVVIPALINGGVDAPSEAVNRAFSFTAPSGWDAYDAALLGGQTASLTGNTSTGLDGDWIIERAWLSSTTVYIILEPSFPEDGAAAVDGTITLKHLRHTLPQDCSNAIMIAMRDSEDWFLEETTRSREARLLLKEDDGAGPPRTYVMSNNITTFKAPQDGSFNRYDYVQAPLDPPTLAATTGGSLVGSATYEYCYIWTWGQMHSARSPVASVTLGASDNQVDISALETTGSSTKAHGRDKIIFRRRMFADREGPWFAVSSTYSYDADLSDDGSFTWPNGNPGNAVRAREYGPGGQRKWLRVYPTPDEDYKGELHYYARPPKMETEADEPVLPPEMHMALVHMVVEELAAEADHKRIADYHHGRLYDERDGVVSNAKRNYLTQVGARFQRQGVMMGGSGMPDVWIQAPTFTEL